MPYHLSSHPGHLRDWKETRLIIIQDNEFKPGLSWANSDMWTLLIKLFGVRAEQREEQEKAPQMQSEPDTFGKHFAKVRGESRRWSLRVTKGHKRQGALSATVTPLAFNPSALGSPQRVLCTEVSWSDFYFQRVTQNCCARNKLHERTKGGSWETS